MIKTETMKKYEAYSGETLEEAEGRGKTLAFLSKYTRWIEAKAAAYDELKCTPNLPDEYNVFLVYLVRNRGDFHKTIRVLTDDGRCSLECVKWFAMMLGISWEPDWR